jgi:hypothetical protein
LPPPLIAKTFATALPKSIEKTISATSLLLYGEQENFTRRTHIFYDRRKSTPPKKDIVVR